MLKVKSTYEAKAYDSDVLQSRPNEINCRSIYYTALDTYKMEMLCSKNVILFIFMVYFVISV